MSMLFGNLKTNILARFVRNWSSFQDKNVELWIPPKLASLSAPHSDSAFIGGAKQSDPPLPSPFLRSRRCRHHSERFTHIRWRACDPYINHYDDNLCVQKQGNGGKILCRLNCLTLIEMRVSSHFWTLETILNFFDFRFLHYSLLRRKVEKLFWSNWEENCGFFGGIEDPCISKSAFHHVWESMGGSFFEIWKNSIFHNTF